MEMLLGGEWRGAADAGTEVIRSPFDGRAVDSVPVATIEDARISIDRAENGARIQ